MILQSSQKQPIEMDSITVINGQNIVDLAIAHYKSVEGVMQLWRDNTFVALTDALVAGSLINADEAELQTDFDVRPSEDVVGTPEDVIVVKGQNNVDLAITHLGSVEGLMELWRENDSLQLNDALEGGVSLKPGQVVDQRIVDLYKQDNISVATGVPDIPDGALLLNGVPLVLNDKFLTLNG